MPHKIAVFDTRLLPEAKNKIQASSDVPITFPTSRCKDEQEFIRRTADADIVLISPWDKVTSSYLDACPNIRYVGLCGTSTANINLDELAKRNITFSNVTHYGDEPTAEFIFMQLTRLTRGVGQYQWKPEQHELMGKAIGIIGLGALGKAIADLAVAYKMNVSYYSLHRKPEWENRGLHFRELADLLRSVEIVIISSPTNMQVLGKQAFSLLKPGSILVQASGGTVFDGSAFRDWIAKEGNYAIFDKAAGTDNYRAYKGLPRVLFADVIAGDTQETLERLGQKVIAGTRRKHGKSEKAAHY